MEQELLEIIRTQILATYGHHEPTKKENNSIPEELQKILDKERESKIARYASEWEPVEQKNNSR